MVPDHDAPVVSLYTFFQVGSRNERPGITGISHLFEHMMFNGAKKYGPKMFDKTMDDNGGSNKKGGGSNPVGSAISSVAKNLAGAVRGALGG